MKSQSEVAQLRQLFATPWTGVCQAPPSMGFCRQEYWSGLPCPPPEGFPNPGIEPEFSASPALAGGLFTSEPPGEPPNQLYLKEELYSL